MRDRTDASGEQVFPREQARSIGTRGETISRMSHGGFTTAGGQRMERPNAGEAPGNGAAKG